jgi:FKBP-type peptidyl-prolyl cis-trans isomerase SlyD
VGAGGLAEAEAEAGSEGIRNLDATMRIQPGKVVAMDYTLRLENGEETVTIDFNHPLAGKTLMFDITIVDVKEPEPDNKKGSIHLRRTNFKCDI